MLNKKYFIIGMNASNYYAAARWQYIYINLLKYNNLGYHRFKIHEREYKDINYLILNFFLKQEC